jgi:hypothetical protein
MRITCYKHPSLLVTTPRVEFVDGVAEVDEATMQELAPLLEEWGIDAADIGGEHAETSPEAPEDATEPEAPEDATPPEEETPKRGKNG